RIIGALLLGVFLRAGPILLLIIIIVGLRFSIRLAVLRVVGSVIANRHALIVAATVYVDVLVTYIDDQIALRELIVRYTYRAIALSGLPVAWAGIVDL